MIDYVDRRESLTGSYADTLRDMKIVPRRRYWAGSDE